MTVKSFKVLLLLTLGSIAAAHAQTSGPAGTAERIKVHGASLEGNHGNRVKERFETKVLPFFSANLKSQAQPGARK